MKPLIRTLSIGAWAASADCFSKLWALHNLHGQIIFVIPHFLEFALVQNYGGSFGIGSEYKHVLLYVPALLGAAAIGWLFQRIRSGAPVTWLDEIGIGLFLGGTLSNFGERLIYHSVTDFLHVDLLDFCIFNLADIFISGGFVLFMLSALWHWHRQRNVSVTDGTIPQSID